MRYADREQSDRLDRDGTTRTHAVERRTTLSGDPFDATSPADHLDAQIVEQRSVRTMDVSAATVNGILGLVLIALDGLLGLRFVLLAFGASRRSDFVSFIYDVSHPFIRPFAGAFINHRWDQGIVEPASLLAIAVYTCAFALIMAAVTALVPAYRQHRDVSTRRTTHA
jgi:hypothetical protein